MQDDPLSCLIMPEDRRVGVRMGEEGLGMKRGGREVDMKWEGKGMRTGAINGRRGICGRDKNGWEGVREGVGGSGSVREVGKLA